MTQWLRFPVVAFGVLALGGLLAACATTTALPVGGVSDAQSPASDATSPYGLYLAGRAAVAGGDSDRASGLFQRASGQDSASPFLAQQAFQAALSAGDVPRAALLAPQGRAAADDEQRHLGQLVRGVDALASGHGSEALAALTAEDVGLPHRGAVGVLIPWAAAAAGHTAQSVAEANVGGDAVAAYFGRLGQARLQERAGRLADAEAGYRQLIAQGDPDSVATLALGAMFERHGNAADAITAYEAVLARNPGDYAVQLARDRARAHRIRPPATTIAQGAAEALVGPARGMLVRGRTDLALDYIRLALRLDPQRADALVILGDLLAGRQDTDGARVAYSQVPVTSPAYPLARAKLVWSLFAAGERDRAIAEAQATAASTPVAGGASLTLAELLRTAGRYDEADRVLSRLIDDPSIRRDWRILYMRANAREDAGRTADAEVDLRAALALSPQQPELLNFLAYTWIDRGERLDEAMVMVRQAAEATPDSPAVQDSLGWGFYRQGNFVQAVEALERAVQLWPANARINDHLGDAYWRVGRHTEAVFQWRRALSLDPDNRLRASAEAKIASPLGPDAPPASAPPATAS